MKNTLITLTSVVALAASVNAQTSLTGTSGTLPGGITYSIAGTSLVDSGSGDYSFAEAGTLTFSFSAPVDFFVDNWQANTLPAVTWGGIAPLSGTFQADAGTWTAVSTDPAKLAFTTTGSSLTGEILSSTSYPTFNTEWGEASISGVTNVSYKSSRNLGSDGFNFAVSPVPEPSSTALLGFGALGLLARRKR